MGYDIADPEMLSVVFQQYSYRRYIYRAKSNGVEKMAEKKSERKEDRVIVESEERAFEEGRLKRAGTGKESNIISEADTERERESGATGESAKKSARWEGT